MRERGGGATTAVYRIFFSTAARVTLIHAALLWAHGTQTAGERERVRLRLSATCY